MISETLYIRIVKTINMLTGARLALSKLFLIPQRYVFAILSLFAIANAYTMRVCLSLAITQMVTTTTSEESVDLDSCPDNYVNTTVSSSSTDDNATSLTKFIFRDTEDVLFSWSESTQGALLSAFYIGYVITHIPGGMLAERFGGKWVVGLGLLSTAVCTCITPVVVRSGGATALFILRVVEGLGEGPTMPGLMSMMARWVPKEERGRVGAIVFGGSQIGNVAGSYISGLVLGNGTWANVFYLYGGVSMIWFILWCLLCYSSPNNHPFISDKEKKFLNDNVDAIVEGSKKNDLDPVPWRALLTSVPLWALIFAGLGHDWGYTTMVTDLPKYMTDVLKYDIETTGFLSALPYLAMWLASMVFGYTCDFFIERKIFSILTARKVYTSIASILPGLCIIAASYSGCNQTVATVWFILAMAFMSAYYAGMKVNSLDISPNYAGTTTAMVNGIAAIAGIITPYLIGLLTPDSTLQQWRVAFWICLAVLLASNIVFVIWADAEQQWWDDVKKHGYPSNWKYGPLPTRKRDSEKPIEEKKEKS